MIRQVAPESSSPSLQPSSSGASVIRSEIPLAASETVPLLISYKQQGTGVCVVLEQMQMLGLSMR